jgi:pimeloyl-ACP methyl ester carboxylesterase
MAAAVTISRVDVDVPGGALACFRFGAAEDRPVALAVHGITANSRSWIAVARALGDRVALIAPDLRGRGASADLPGPYGIEAHIRDLLAVLDALGAERSVLVGHSLGAYIVAGLGFAHPERAHRLVLVDGGLAIPGTEAVDLPAFLEAFLGPALARLRLRFPTREAYRLWWRGHPAFAGGDVADEDLAAYADHDLLGAPPELHSSVVEAAVRADGAGLVPSAIVAPRLTVPTRLLCAPRGLLDDPNPMQPMAVAEAWAAADPERREAILVPDVNHYTITLGTAGARAVADSIAAAVQA